MKNNHQYIETKFNADEYVMIKKSELSELKWNTELLDALYAADLENWNGYNIAMEMIDDYNTDM